LLLNGIQARYDDQKLRNAGRRGGKKNKKQKQLKLHSNFPGVSSSFRIKTPVKKIRAFHRPDTPIQAYLYLFSFERYKDKSIST